MSRWCKTKCDYCGVLWIQFWVLGYRENGPSVRGSVPEHLDTGTEYGQELLASKCGISFDLIWCPGKVEPHLTPLLYLTTDQSSKVCVNMCHISMFLQCYWAWVFPPILSSLCLWVGVTSGYFPDRERKWNRHDHVRMHFIMWSNSCKLMSCTKNTKKSGLIFLVQ